MVTNVVALTQPINLSDIQDDVRKTLDARERVPTLLDMLAAQRIPLLAYHMPWPGIGHLAKHGDGFRYVATPMQLVL